MEAVDSLNAAGISINEANFPDENFRSFVMQYDTDSDGALSESEIAAVTKMTCRGIADLKGIEFFINLTTLTCSYSKLTHLDLSANTSLTELNCVGNSLTELDLQYNTLLTKLICCSNRLTTLDLSHNTALEYLDCGSNKLTNLDLSSNTTLKELYCYLNKSLISIDVSKCTSLELLDCYSCQLQSLDLRSNIALVTLSCFQNPLHSLDITNNTLLEDLYCAGNALTSLDVSHNTRLKSLNCNSICYEDTAYNESYEGNALSSIDLSNNKDLESLELYGNKLTTLDLSNNPALKRLIVSNNFLTSLDLSNLHLKNTPYSVRVVDNSYTITVTENNRLFDLTSLPGKFDVSKASDWTGGTVNGNILIINKDADTVSYTYDCGDNRSAIFTLNVTTIADKKHTILDGSNSTWYADSSKALSIRGDGEIENFIGVNVDNTLVDSANYTISEGSTIVTLKPEYLSTLSSGKHTIELHWIDGSASTSFTVSKSNSNSDSDANANNTKGFVIRLYKNVLGRTPDTNGLNAWVSVLQRGSNGGEEVAKGFIFSNEYINKHTSDDAFVEMLYNTLLNRKSDANGRKAWVNQLTSGKETREGIVEGFIHSDEFNKICDTYGIYPTAAEAFASRLYTKCLGRDYDKAGLKAWGNLLHTRQIGGGEAAKGFFFSPEFVNKNLSDKEFVTRCYRTFLGREADTNGLNSWVQLLQTGSSREDILEGFIGSDEYGKLCISYGINR